mgnify:CR=1 FL=1
MFVTKRSVSLLLSSDPTLGAVNRSADGSTFEVEFSRPLDIPKEALDVEVSMQSATVWWTVPNILEGKNDTFYIDDNGTPYAPVIPEGLYDTPGLNAALVRELSALGAPVGLLTLGQDDNSGRVILQFALQDTSVDFTPLDTPRDILGFDSQVVGPSPAPPPGGITSVLAPNVAAFNTVNSFLIHGDIVSNGIQLNGLYSQILGRVLIDQPPGSQLLSTPFNPPKVEANELKGALRKRIRMQLTDQSNRAVNTAGEYWTAQLEIVYQVPHESSLRH